MEGPLLQSVPAAPTVSAMLDRRSACVSQVPVKPPLAQHRDEYGERRDQETCVHQSSHNGDLCGRVSLGGWNRRGLVWDGGLVEGEEEHTKESCRSFAWVSLRPELMSTANMELTAESRPAYGDRLDGEQE